MTTEDRNRIKRQDREVIGLGEFTDSDLVAIAAMKPSTARALTIARKIAKEVVDTSSQGFLAQRQKDSGE